MFEQNLNSLADRRAAAQRVINSVLGGFNKPVLLIFDNLEDEQLLRTWLPRVGAQALATSRDRAWTPDMAVVDLEPWTLDTARDYLQRASGPPDLSADDAGAIVKTLGALPLALSHTAATLRNLKMVSPTRYLERIVGHLKKAPQGSEYPTSVFATFRTAIAQAEQQASGSAAVLCFAASFACDDIPGELFRQTDITGAANLSPALDDGAAIDLQSALADDLVLDEALATLDRLSLLDFTNDSRSYSVHRLVQLAAKDLMGGEPDWLNHPVRVADLVFPNVELETWPQCERLIAHAIAALDALPNDSDLLPGANLAIRCSSYLLARGDYETAEALSKRALTVHQRALASNSPEIAASLNALAYVYWKQARYAEAEPLNIRALAIQEALLGPQHVDIAKTLNGLALVYWTAGRYAEAEPLYARALQIWETELGPDHPYVAHTLNNLAILYLEQDRYAEAEPLQIRALALRENTLGPNHPDVASSLHNLAVAYHYQGRHDEAEPLHVRALAIKETALGKNHPDVARSLNDLANVQRDQGRYAEAESTQLRALAIWEKALGPDHPDVAQSLNDLGALYRSQGRCSEAQLLLTRALTIREKAFGLDHAEVAESLNDLGLTLSDRHLCQEAEPLLSRALSIRLSTLGPDHAQTKATREALDALSSH